jgi:hypothetical protein
MRIHEAFTFAALFYTCTLWCITPWNIENDYSDATSGFDFLIDANITEKFKADYFRGPWVVWLMSFPNSGTSYTMRLVKQTSQTLVATNYQKTESYEGRQLYPVYSNYSVGPFWPDPNQTKYLRPSSYILTKTHCGTRCNDCRPSDYLNDPLSFSRKCLSGSKSKVTSNGEQQTVKVAYHSKLVHKAIHLVRDPFDNIVSRFHLERHRMEKKKDNEALARYPDSREGFRHFCQNQDDKFLSEVEDSWLADNEGMRNVLCRDDFYRYTLWHNLAFTTTKDIMKLPTYILHYEDYSDSFNKTVSKLLSFLDLEQASEPYPFKKGHTYKDYFSQDERKAVKEAMKASSIPETWRNIQHYFN